MKQSTLKKGSYAILVSPALIIYTSVIIIPIFYSLALSFTSWSGFGKPIFIGIENYIKMLSDSIYRHGLRNNLLIVFVSVFGQIPLGFTLAYVIYRKMVKGRNFFESMIFLPITISSVVVAILWNQMFSSAGIITAIFRFITNNPRYVFTITEHRELAVIPVLFVILWMHTGTYMIIFLANMQKISPSVLEAAVIDGASEMKILGNIILPSMINIIFTCAIFAISGSLKAFDLIIAMTGGGPAHFTEVIAIYMYLNTFKYNKYGFGSAVSISIVALSLGMINILKFVVNKFEKKYI